MYIIFSTLDSLYIVFSPWDRVFNAFSTLDILYTEFSPFIRLFLLNYLPLIENPAAEEEDYRLEVLITLRKLERLDKEEYNDEEREEAEQIYEQRRQEELAAEVKWGWGRGRVCHHKT